MVSATNSVLDACWYKTTYEHSGKWRMKHFMLVCVTPFISSVLENTGRKFINIIGS